MTISTLETRLWDWLAINSWDLIEKLSSPESISFEKIKECIDSLSMDQLREFIEDLIYTDEISLTKKAMSFKILYHGYTRDLFPGVKWNGIHILMMYYSKLSSISNPTEWIKTRVFEIIDNEKNTQYTKGYVERILLNDPFAMPGSEINQICKTLWIK